MKDNGICIRSTDYSDTSQILTFFTQRAGKVSLFARGTKRMKSSFGGPIQLCSIGNIVFLPKDDDKLGTLTEFNPTFLCTNIKKRLLALHCSLLAAELLNLLTKEHDPHPEMFTETVVLFEKLERCPNMEILHWAAVFELTILGHSGLAPVCNACANCKRLLATDWQRFYFSPTANGLLCQDCEGVFADRLAIAESVARYFNAPVLDCLNTITLGHIQVLLIKYLTFILERPLKTASVLLKLIK